MILEKIVGPSHKFSDTNPGSFDLDGLSGKVVEFSGWDYPACISLTLPLILENQSRDRDCAWIVPNGKNETSLFFPPDFASAGINCSRIPVIWSESANDSLGIAEKLIRSGGFGLLILDLTNGKRVRTSNVGRINTLAQKFGSLVLCLTRNPPGRPSMDPMIFLHVQASCRKLHSGQMEITATILKDKSRAPGSNEKWIYEAPPGMC